MNIGLSIVCGVLTASGFGIADFAAKLSTDRMGFLRTGLYLQIIGSFFVLPLALPQLYRVLIDPWVSLAAICLGVINAIGTLFLYKGFEVGRLSIVSPIASTAPLVGVLLAIAFLGEILTKELLLGISLIISGVVLVSLQPSHGWGSKVAAGTAFAIGFMLCGGFLLFGLKPVTAAFGPFLPVLIMRWVGILVLAVPAIRTESKGLSSALKPVLPIAFFDTFANVAYTLGVSFGTVTVVAPLGGMFSSVTVLLAWLFLKEKPSRHQILGFVVILLGIVTLGLFT